MSRYRKPLALRPSPGSAVPATAMVMAAGLGKRMRPLTATRPKPLIEVAGKPLIEHALERLEAAGVKKAVVNVHYLGDAIEAHLKNRVEGLEIVVSDERAQLLETGGGLARALPLIDSDPFLVVNSDNLWVDGPVDALKLLAAGWDEARMEALESIVREPLWNDRRGDTGPFDVIGDVHGCYRLLMDLLPRLGAERVAARLRHRVRQAEEGREVVVHAADRVLVAARVVLRERLDDHPGAVGGQRLPDVPGRGQRITHVVQAVERRHQVVVPAAERLRAGHLEAHPVGDARLGRPLDLPAGLPHLALGRVNNDRMLSTIYSAADVFVTSDGRRLRTSDVVRAASGRTSASAPRRSSSIRPFVRSSGFVFRREASS